MFTFTHQITSGTITLTRSGHVCVFAEQCEGMSSCLSSQGFVLCHTWQEMQMFLYIQYFTLLALTAWNLPCVRVCESVCVGQP